MLSSFKIIPILGLKTDVPINDPSLFKMAGNNVALTHDTGGQNVSYTRKRNACTKDYGYAEWSNTATAQATKCLGLFELAVGTTLDHIFFDNGKCYVYDNANDPVVKEDSGTTTFANDNKDLYSAIQVGEYMVFADRAEHTPYKWKNAESNLTKLIQSGTEYKFRYLESFQRRVIGAYSDQTDGDIEIRWSTDWPTTAITSLNFPAANQAWIPNDDTITGIRRMGLDRCYIYCDDSIHSLNYASNYKLPFYLRNINNAQGCEGHHSVVNLGDRHYFFNRNYGFCEFRGDTFPFGGRPISYDIETTIQGISTQYMSQIVGTFSPKDREVAWAVPLGGAAMPTHILFYNIDTGHWRKRNIAARYIDNWRINLDYTWSDLASDVGGTGTWADAGSAWWADYISESSRFVHGNTDGDLHYTVGENYNTANFDGYRIEPAMDFGDSSRVDILQEIWFSIGSVGSFSIDIYHRSADTVGALASTSWTALDSLSCNSPTRPRITCQKTGRFHQIKWGTDLKDEKFEVHSIELMYNPQGRL